MMVWFRLWWFAFISQGMWKDPVLSAITLAKTIKIVLLGGFKAMR